MFPELVKRVVQALAFTLRPRSAPPHHAPHHDALFPPASTRQSVCTLGCAPTADCTGTLLSHSILRLRRHAGSSWSWSELLGKLLADHTKLLRSAWSYDPATASPQVAFLLHIDCRAVPCCALPSICLSSEVLRPPTRWSIVAYCCLTGLLLPY